MAVLAPFPQARALSAELRQAVGTQPGPPNRRWFPIRVGWQGNPRRWLLVGLHNGQRAHPSWLAKTRVGGNRLPCLSLPSRIAVLTQSWGSGCARARLSADGRLYTCLFAGAGHDLRGPLRAGATTRSCACRSPPSGPGGLTATPSCAPARPATRTR